VDELNPTAAALLGFLDAGELSGYELAKAATEIIGDFWHVTRSQVYRELASLTEHGLIEPAGDGSGPRARRPYRITPAGRAAFAAWITRQPPLEQVRFPLLLTMSFGRWVGPGRLLEFTAAHRAAHQDRLARYQALLADGGLDSYLRATVSFGVRYEQAVLAWMDSLPALLADAGPPGPGSAAPGFRHPAFRAMTLVSADLGTWQVMKMRLVTGHGIGTRW
jgi:DNA-binding PadR family transcriptional regulator